ncbi:MAG: hypothetical protein HY787_21245 [Deltaproteobacteria bacterium]|nr:hypothetical protein [Deltaproteobacteria bacterium]
MSVFTMPDRNEKPAVAGGESARRAVLVREIVLSAIYLKKKDLLWEL